MKRLPDIQDILDPHASDSRDVCPNDDFREAEVEMLRKRVHELERENQALRLELMRDREAQAGW